MHFLLARTHMRQGVLGRVYDLEERNHPSRPTPMFWTVEQSWNGNTPFKSCVPAGTYRLCTYQSPKHGRTFAIEGGTVALYERDLDPAAGVTRFACLFGHIANRPDEVEGCFGLGESPGVGCAVANSRAAMDRFRADYVDPAFRMGKTSSGVVAGFVTIVEGW